MFTLNTFSNRAVTNGLGQIVVFTKEEDAINERTPMSDELGEELRVVEVFLVPDDL